MKAHTLMGLSFLTTKATKRIDDVHVTATLRAVELRKIG